jgi:hypothetical protein
MMRLYQGSLHLIQPQDMVHTPRQSYVANMLGHDQSSLPPLLLRTQSTKAGLGGLFLSVASVSGSHIVAFPDDRPRTVDERCRSGRL